MRRSARALAARAAYPRESLEAAASAVGADAEIALSTRGRNWRIEVRTQTRRRAADVLGELLNEALSHALRQRLLRQERRLAGAVVARLLEKGFPAAPADPLEQLEPQVRLDRAGETNGLLAAAREMT